MTHLTFIQHQSWSKVGTIAGLVLGYGLTGGHSFAGDLLSVIGTTVGAFISMPAQKSIIDHSGNMKQLQILKDHFAHDGNPLQTNYNLYERDPVGKCLSWIESFKSKILSKFTTVEPCVSYRNKMLSEKYIVFDTFHDTDAKSIILDIAPLLTITGVNGYKSYDNAKNGWAITGSAALKTLLDTAIVYGSKPIINYILYTQDNLNDYEKVELDFNKNEIKLFEDVLPPELAVEVNRVAA